MMGLRVLVCGGRDFADRDLLFTTLDGIARDTQQAITIIEGGARGADRLARDWAQLRKYPVVTFSADWQRHGRAAGPIRNAQMIREGNLDLVVAFPGGSGTRNMVGLARRAGVHVIEVPGRVAQ